VPDRKLARRILLKRRTLKTMSGAVAIIEQNLATVIHDEALAYAIRLTTIANASGKRADIEAATYQLEIVLRIGRLMAD
jgi:hypothetical protein